MTFGQVYKITNKETKECYIGATVNINRRWKQQQKKYPLTFFDYEIIEQCNDRETLQEKEIFYIKKFNSVENGYNGNYVSNIRGNGNYNYSTIRLEEKTALRLRKHQESLSETYDDIIKKLLDFYEVNNKNEETRNI